MSTKLAAMPGSQAIQLELALPRNIVLTDLAKLLNHITLLRRTPNDWAFFHTRITDNKKANLGEVAQLLEYYLSDHQAYILRNDIGHEILTITSTRGSGKKLFTVVENEIHQAMAGFSIRTLSNLLTESGVEQLAKIITAIVPAGDVAARMALRRFSRPANVFMVLDDDPVVLRQMDNMLKSYGHVETHTTVPAFLEAYNQYAPNAVFVDIHLQGRRGTDVSGMIMEKIDPGAYVVMISADAVKPNILESKFRGARGFIGKPVSMEMVLRYVLATPTLYQKV